MPDSIIAVVRDSSHQPPVTVREVEAPAPAPDEALVDVHASTINRGELALLAGRPDGWRPGQDLAGVIAAPASDGSGPPAGARVLGTVDGGAWATQVAAPTRRLAILPDEVSFPDAAALGIAGLTALRVVRRAGALLGRRVLVTGATGGVGHLAAQLADISGAHVTGDDLRAGPFDVILEGIGGRALESAVGALAPGGILILYGASDPEPAELTLLSFIGHENARIETFFSYAAAQNDAADLSTLAGMVANRRLAPNIAASYPLAKTADALRALAGRRVHGKLVLVPCRSD